MKRGVKSLCVGLALGVAASTAFVGGAYDAEAATGSWKHNARGYWYSYSDGSYAKNQWLCIGGKWYFFASSGYMYVGWLKQGFKWYYLNPSTGAMTTGWGMANGNWYYFDASGAMVTGWKKIGGKWYFFKASGEMVTGWRKISNQWYYFTSSGAMVTGTVTIGGVKYTFNSNGEWIEGAGGYNIGDTIKFGKYEQDNDTKNGAEDIEWTVLAVSGDSVLVVSKYALDSKKYNEKQTDVSWETCSLRKWLNSDFYDTAFTAADKKKIKASSIENPNNLVYKTAGGKTTKDNVFLLSMGEAIKYFNLTTDSKGNYVGTDSLCQATAYAKAQGAEYTYRTNYTWYWLRSPGTSSDYATNISTGGALSAIGAYVGRPSLGVRPAMWITP